MPAKVWIDGTAYEVDPARNLLDVCLSLGLDLPYFCWHPALGSVGACRQCAVKQYRDEQDPDGILVMACMTPAADGTRIAIDDPDAEQLRRSVIEWLMTNHPHDCPVCDEGGECHLQDMTVKTGHNYRRYRFAKRTYRNQDLGPLVNHEMNRCIQCYRCVRFYDDYAGGQDLRAFGAHDHVYFGRHQDGVLESELSGNLVEVCPTGVFTDKSLKRHYTRKWDLRTAPSVCVHCSLGCNTTPGERYGELRRIRNRYHGKVNGYFLCDRGRYGYEFTRHERRLRRPLLPQGADRPARPIAREEALRHLAPLLSDPGRLIGIGSPRASLEANFALRTLVGAERFFDGVSDRESRLTRQVLVVLRRGPARAPSLREVEACDAVLVLGEDVTNTAPMLALALRQSVRREPSRMADPLGIPSWHDAAIRGLLQSRLGPLYVATAAATKLDGIARAAYRAVPEDLARLAFAAAHAVDPQAPAVADLEPDAAALAEEIAARLGAAERPLILAGTSAGSAALVEAAANLAWALSRRRRSPADLHYVVPECNSLGLALLGGPDQGGLEAATSALERGDADTLVVLENDLYRRLPAAQTDRLLAAAEHLVVLDHLAHPTAARAEVLLPAATFAEGDGTLVNNEGRAQRFFRVFPPEGEAAEIQESWRWLRDAMGAAGRTDAGWQRLDDLVQALAEQVPGLSALPAAAPRADFRRSGAKLPRALHRYSGRTAELAHLDVHEPQPPADPDSPLSFTMEGYDGQAPGALAADFWSPGWNSIQALNRFQEEVAGPLRGGDPGIRLLEPTEGSEPPFFTAVPARFSSREDEWRVVALHHIFGSEELSVLAPGIAELAPRPYVALGTEEAARLEVEEGETVEVVIGEERHRLELRIRPELGRGRVGLPQGLPGLALDTGAEWARLRKVAPE